MTTETNSAGYLPVSQPVAALLRPLQRLVSRVDKFLEAVRVANAVSKQAARYYAMNSAQLAEIGLTREQVATALLRQLDGVDR